MIWAGDEARRVALDALCAAEQLLATKRLGVGEIATGTDTEQSDVACQLIEVGRGEFGRSAGSLAVEHRKNRSGHAHVGVEGGGDLVAEARLPGFAGEATETPLAGLRVQHRLNAAGD